MLQRPEVLLLDEPETHLDLPHREHLERLIRDFAGAVVIVSHDRYLLDETVSEIAELEHGHITLWPGNYSAYTVAREVALQRQQVIYVAQQKEIARLEEAIARFKLWASIVVNERHIKQARNKQRQIDRMDKVERPVLQRRTMALKLRSGARGGQKVLELQDVSMAFGDDADPARRQSAGHARRARRHHRPERRGQERAGKLLTGELAPTEGERLDRAEHPARLLRPGARDARSRRRRWRSCAGCDQGTRSRPWRCWGATSSPTSSAASR